VPFKIDSIIFLVYMFTYMSNSSDDRVYVYCNVSMLHLQNRVAKLFQILDDKI
jgi:hypothetical protein